MILQRFIEAKNPKDGLSKQGKILVQKPKQRDFS